MPSPRPLRVSLNAVLTAGWWFLILCDHGRVPHMLISQLTCSPLTILAHCVWRRMKYLILDGKSSFHSFHVAVRFGGHYSAMAITPLSTVSLKCRRALESSGLRALHGTVGA